MSKNAEGWIRHRGGRSPVGDFDKIEYRMRSGQIMKTGTGGMLNWGHGNWPTDIMAYRLHKPAEQVEQAVNMQAMGECAAACGDSHADVMADVISRLDGPRQWRDRIAEIDAEVKALTSERAELVQKLASEGFALIGRVVEPAEDMSDWRNWRAGDLVECTGKSSGYSPGSIYAVKSINHDRALVHTVIDDSGSITNGWGCNMFVWKSRPSA